MNTLLHCSPCIWTGLLDKLPCTLVWITVIIALIFLMKYLFHLIEMKKTFTHEKEMMNDKDKRERWWHLQNEIKKDLNILLAEKANEIAEKIVQDNEDSAKKKNKENLEKDVLQAEHDWYKKLLKDIKDLDLNLNPEQKKNDSDNIETDK